MRGTQTFTIDHDHFAGFDVTHVLRVDQVKRARFRGYDPGVAEPAERQRSKATAVANGDELRGRQEQHRERALGFA